MILLVVKDSNTLGITKSSDIGRKLEILKKSEDGLGIGLMKLVFRTSGKVPEERNKLNKYAKGMEITNLKFLENILGTYYLVNLSIKSDLGLDMLYLSVPIC